MKLRLHGSQSSCCAQHRGERLGGVADRIAASSEGGCGVGGGTGALHRRLARLYLLSTPLVLSAMALADNTPLVLPVHQAWSNTGLITTANNWSGVPGFVGYRGDGLTNVTGADPQTILADGTTTPVNVAANQSNPAITIGGLAEFDGISDPVVALQAANLNPAPFLLLNLNTTGRQGIQVFYRLRDIDASADNSVQPVALQFRVGNAGNFINVPAAFVSDASTGPGQATFTVNRSVTLPASADNQPLVQLRWITANAAGNDEWIGIDDIVVTNSPAGPPLTLVNLGRNPVGTLANNGGGSFTIVGGGNDAWDNMDECAFAHHEVTGDFDVRVRVESLSPNARWTKAGLMVRETLAEDSRMAFNRVTPPPVPTSSGGLGANDTFLSYRTGIHEPTGNFADDHNGGMHEDPIGAVLPPPYPNAWLRLVRSGPEITAWNSDDGVNWFFMTSQDTRFWNGGPLKATVLVGLAVSRHPGDGVTPSGPTATAEFRQYQIEVGGETPFAVAGASSRGNPTGVLVEFTHPVGPSAFEPFFYSVSGASVDAAAPGPNASTVRLTTSPLSEDQFYQVFVSFGVTDVNGQPFEGANFTQFRHGEGYELRPIRVARNMIPGPEVSTFLNSVAYARDLPTACQDFPAVTTPFSFFEDDTPNDQSHENYSARISGLVRIDTPGNYRFACASDDKGILYLSSDDSPINKVEIAREPEWAATPLAFASFERRNPTNPENLSASIGLQPGDYYLEYSYAEGGGGNHAAVAWDFGSGAPFVDGESPMNLGNFTPFRMFGGTVFFNLGPVFVRSHPQNQTVSAGQTATFRVKVDGTPPYSLQWLRNGLPIPGATGYSYTTPPLTSSGDGTFYFVQINNEFSSVTSDAALVTVTQTAPLIELQPQDQTVPDCGLAQFQVVAIGNPPLSYQWRRNGINLLAQTNQTLALPNVGLANAGDYTVRVSDSGGATTSSVARLTVLNAPPSVAAPSAVIVATGPGACSASGVNLGIASATDECGGLSVSSNAPAIFPLGLTVVTWTAVDRNGISSSASQNVTVADRQPPTIALPSNQVVECAGPGGTPVSFSASAFDNCGGTVPVNYSRLPGSLFPPGVTAVIVTASDTNGNSTNRSFTVTVSDTTAPSLTMPANLTVECAGGAGTPVSFAASATDTCGGNLPVTYSHPPGSLFVLGTTAVNVTAADGSGNASNGTFTVTVRDTTAPRPALCLDPPLVIDQGGHGAPSSTPVMPRLDLLVSLQGQPIRNFDQTTPGAVFVHSWEDVTDCVTDSTLAIGLIASGPTAPDDVVSLGFAEGGEFNPVWSGRLGEGGPAGLALLTQEPWVPGAQETVMLNLARLPLADGTMLNLIGLLAEKRFLDLAIANDTAVDFTVLTIDSCRDRPDLVVNSGPGQAGTLVFYEYPEFTDNCGPVVTVSSPMPPGTFFPIGSTLVPVHATDGSGNMGRSWFRVICRDLEPPTIECPTNQLAECVKLGGAPIFYTVTSRDNSGQVTTQCFPPSGSVFPIGNTPVQCLAFDTNGNTVHCTFPVTLTAAPPTSIYPVGLRAAMVGNNVVLSFQSQAGLMYGLEYKDNLADSGWQELTQRPGNGGVVTLTDPLGARPHRFYRVRRHLEETGSPFGAATTLFEPPEPPPAQPGPSDPCRPALCGPPYVYLFSGEFHYETTDLCIKGRGLDFVWARKYRSCPCFATPLGHRWDYSYNICVARNGPNLDVFDGNTRQDTYFAQPDGSYVADQFFREGRLDAANQFTLTFADRGKWIFLPLDGAPAQGRIGRIEDRNGNALRFAYDASGRLTNVTDTLDRNIRVSYDVDGFIDAVTDFAGRQVRYAHYHEGDAGGSFGDLKSATSPVVAGTANGNNFPAGKTVTYTYSKGSPDPQQNHLLLTITDAKGQIWLQNTYVPPAGEFCNRVVRQVWGYANEVLSYDYSAQTPGAANNFAIVRAIVNDRVGNVSEYYFDAGNRCVLHREFTGRAVPGQFTTATQNRPQNKLRAADPDWFETRYEWNVDSLLTGATYPNGNRTENVYELELDPGAARRSRGNLRVCRKLPGPLGADQAVLLELFDYESGAGGGCCDFNFVTKHTDARGHVMLHSYDARGNRLRTQHRVPSAIEDWEYNEYGQVTAHLLPDNGSGHRRRDVSGYYGAGVQRGYLAERIEDAGGFALTIGFEYDAVGNVIRAVDPRGADTLYTVNALNQVVRETSREVTPGTGLRYQRDFFYDANNNLVREDVENRADTGALQANTHFTTVFDYEILNRVARVAREKGSAHPLHGVLNYEAIEFALRPQFVAIEYAYDANRNRTSVRHGEATAGFDPFNVVGRQYDERDLLFRETRAPGSPLASTAQHDYDGNKNLKRVSRGLENGPRVTLHAYDGYNRQTATTDAMGNVTTFRYDANNNCVSTRVDGELTDLNGGAGNRRLAETFSQYDAMDRRIQEDKSFFDPRTQATIGDGLARTLTFYNDNSQIARVTGDGGFSTVTLHDTANRRSAVIDPKNNSVSYTYDANGSVVVTTEAERSDLGNPPQIFSGMNRYDGLDRLIESVSAGGATNRYAYDSRHNRVWEADPLNHETRHAYDGMNRLVQTVRDLNGNGASAADPADLVTRQIWDDSCRLIAQADGNGRTTRYAYDSLDRRIITRLADGTMHLVGAGSVNWPEGHDRPALNEFYTNGHDVHDNALMTTDANGTVVATTFDLLNRPASKSIARATGVLGTSFENLQYNGVSLLTLARNNETLVTRGYDSLCHLVRESINFEAPSFPSNRDRVTIWTCDGMGNPLSCAYPGGRVVTRTYDELNRLKRVCDGACAATIAEYSYFGPARVEMLCYGNGTCGQFGYDTGRDLIATMHRKPATGFVLDQRTYVMARNGNKTEQADVRLAGPELSHAYSYDAVNGLVRTVVASPVSLAERDSIYTLDRAGNRLNVTSDPPPGNYTFNATLPEPADPQVNQYTATPFDTGRQHEANGELVSILGGVNPATFEYDYRGLLARATVGGGTPVLYTYDVLGRRVQRVFGASVTRHFHDGGGELEEQDALGNTLATFVSGRHGNELLTMRRMAGDFYFHSDDSRSVRALSDAAGNPIERYDYGDYGEPLFTVHVQAPNAVTAFISDVDGVQRIADDFVFGRPVRIFGVRWWGAYVSGSVPPIDNFTIRIRANSGGVPSGVVRTETPGNNVRRFPTGRVLASGQAEFIYEADFATPLDIPAGATWWLEIANNTAGQAASWALSSAGYGNQILGSSLNSGASWQISAADTAFELFTGASSLENPYLFAGHRYDLATGLYDFGARLLDPLTGRFTTRDPAGVWAEAANLGNGFSFAGNNPASPPGPALAPFTAPVPAVGCGKWERVDYCAFLARQRGEPYHCWLKQCGTGCISSAGCQRPARRCELPACGRQSKPAHPSCAPFLRPK